MTATMFEENPLRLSVAKTMAKLQIERNEWTAKINASILSITYGKEKNEV